MEQEALQRTRRSQWINVVGMSGLLFIAAGLWLVSPSHALIGTGSILFILSVWSALRS